MSSNEWMNQVGARCCYSKETSYWRDVEGTPLGNQSNCIIRNEFHSPSVLLVPLIPSINRSHFD